MASIPPPTARSAISPQFAPSAGDLGQRQHDTLDLSGFSSASVISLVPGTFSRCDAMTSNLAIARNCWIERDRRRR
jgi:hypothetical protein